MGVGVGFGVGFGVGVGVGDSVGIGVGVAVGDGVAVVATPKTFDLFIKNKVTISPKRIIRRKVRMKFFIRGILTLINKVLRKNCK